MHCDINFSECVLNRQNSIHYIGLHLTRTSNFKLFTKVFILIVKDVLHLYELRHIMS